MAVPRFPAIGAVKWCQPPNLGNLRKKPTYLSQIWWLAPFFKTTGPNGDRPGECDLETTRDFVKRSGAQIGINSGFFSRTAEERQLGVADLSSLAVSDGVRVSDWGTWIKDAFNVAADNTVTFVVRPKDAATGYATEPNVDLYNAMAGNVRLLKDGTIPPGPGGDATYPQTAVGHTADHRLVLFVSDGRQPGFSAITITVPATKSG